MSLTQTLVPSPLDDPRENGGQQLDLLTFLGRVAVLQSMPYQDYLQTPEWRELRKQALARAHWRCQLNAHHWRDLEVHHRTYARRGVEQLDDLTVLCRGCHHHVHAYMMGEPAGPAAAVAA